MKKDKEWLKEEIKKVSNNYPAYHDERDDLIKKMVNMHEILELIDQLDEPEITEEQAWKIIAKSTNRPVMFWENMRDNYLSSLKEPELPAIPQFVADVLKEYKDNKYKTLYGLFFDVEREMITGEFGDWFVTYGNYEVFCRAWLDGYTIEKETMHYVIFLESEDKEKGQALYKDFNFNGDKVVSTHIEPFSKRIALEAGNFHFTEQEIKSIDERYWSFREEVENV